MLGEHHPPNMRKIAFGLEIYAVSTSNAIHLIGQPATVKASGSLRASDTNMARSIIDSGSNGILIYDGNKYEIMIFILIRVELYIYSMVTIHFHFSFYE